MRDMDVFGQNNKTNKEQRISSLLECAVICGHCILKDSLCDCEHCAEAYTEYLEVNNKTEEEDLKESGFVDKEEVEELDDLDRLYAFNKGETLRVNVWFSKGQIEPTECLVKLCEGTKLERFQLRIFEQAPYHWSYILEGNAKPNDEDMVEIKVVIEERLIELSRVGITRLSKFITNDYESEYL